MFFMELFLAVVVSFVVTSILVSLGKTGPWNNLGSFFLIIFLITWAGGIWLAPVGPTFYGSNWASFVIIGGLLALFFANIIPHKDIKIIKAPEEKLAKGDPSEIAAIASLGASFWIFIIAVSLCIALSYLL